VSDAVNIPIVVESQEVFPERDARLNAAKASRLLVLLMVLESDDDDDGR